MIKRITVILLFLSGLGSTVFAQEGNIKTELSEGIEYYQQGKYEQALKNFNNITANPSLDASLGDAYFWLSKSQIILNKLDSAEKSLDFFLINYPSHKYTVEARYLKGRLLFLQGEFESSILSFQDFIDTYSDSAFIPNAYFWVGEALFQLGNFDSSEKIMDFVLKEFPRSVKVEAAKYRISLIRIKKRENELLKLLKLSHEEALKTMEEFQRKERTYEQAISAYQRKLTTSDKVTESALSKNDQEEDTEKKDEEIASLKNQITLLNQRISELLSSSTETESEETESDTADLSAYKQLLDLLYAKEDALELKAYLLELSQSGGQ
jgi:TolA-binding protein